MSDIFEKFIEDGKLVITGLESGPKVVIIVAVHGNEPCGVEALKQILARDFKIKKGAVTFLLGSKKAFEKKVRSYESNLNRMFRADKDLSEIEQDSYEYKVSRNIMSELDSADILLDIHSSSAPDTQPFVICEPYSYEYASVLPASVVLSGLDKLHPLGTDGYMNKIGKYGLCIECGNHNDPKAVQIATDSVLSLLTKLEMFDEEKLVAKHQQEYIQAESIYTCKEVFKTIRSFGDFEQVNKNDLIGYDGDNEVRTSENGVVLFVSDEQQKGGEAFVTGRRL